MKKLIFNFILLTCSTNLFAQTIVNGGVSGTWTSTNNPYYVNGDITVPQGKTLIIEPGVDIYFVGTYLLKIDGLIQAEGTMEKRITFRGDGGAGSWKSIYFAETAVNGSILNYCIIKDGGYEESNIFIENADTNITIVNCEITNSLGHGIYIKANLITYSGDNITKKCNPMITNNSIHDNRKNGIYVVAYYMDTSDVHVDGANNNTCISSPMIKNNSIYKNMSNAIECYTFANGAYTRSMPDNFSTIQSNPKIQQNTFYMNSKNGVYCSNIIQDNFANIIAIEAIPHITSNIFSNCGEYGINTNNEVPIFNVKHNDFWKNAFSNLSGIAGGLGKNNRTNLNGDSCDVNLNIYFDPDFLDENKYDFHLKIASKCINAGDLNLPFDPDNTFPDIGAYYYDHLTAVMTNQKLFQPSDFVLSQNYPNPFNPSTTIEFSIPYSSHVVLKVYDLLGKEIATLVDEELSEGHHKVNWNAQNFASGVYIYKFQGGEFVQMKKMILIQ